MIFQMASTLLRNDQQWQALKFLRGRCNYFSSKDQLKIWSLIGIGLHQRDQASHSSIVNAAKQIRSRRKFDEVQSLAGSLNNAVYANFTSANIGK